MQFRHVCYLLVYISCGSLFSLLVKKSSQDNGGKQPYEPVAVTFSVESFKLTTSLIMIFLVNNRDQSPIAKLNNLLSKWHVAKQFAVPAFLYAIFNALAFYNLRLVSPPTYRLLINLKVLFSGLLLQGLIGTRLSRRQWAGLVLLVAACGVEQWDSFDMATGVTAILLICFQAFCSSFAGVYFQLLLQIRPQTAVPSASAAANEELGLWEKNFFMYCWSIFFNVAYLALANTEVLLHPGNALATFDAQVVPIILLSGIGGVSTSLILRDMDVIVKEYANFAEMMVVVLGAYLALNTPLHSTLFLAVAMVTASLYLYNVPSESDGTSSSSHSPVALKEVRPSEDPRPLLAEARDQRV